MDRKGAGPPEIDRYTHDGKSLVFYKTSVGVAHTLFGPGDEAISTGHFAFLPETRANGSETTRYIKETLGEKMPGVCCVSR
jgi:hypothetical protein